MNKSIPKEEEARSCLSKSHRGSLDDEESLNLIIKRNVYEYKNIHTLFSFEPNQGDVLWVYHVYLLNLHPTCLYLQSLSKTYVNQKLSKLIAQRLSFINS